MRAIGALMIGTFVLGALAGCGERASYEERMDYLRTLAKRGAETHALLKSQDAKIDRKRCEGAYQGLSDGGDMPSDRDNGGISAEWSKQMELFFVDSCVSGKPKPVPGDATRTPSPRPPTATSTSAGPVATSPAAPR
jgi:hypothetical protein